MKFTEISGQLEQGMWSYQQHPTIRATGKDLVGLEKRPFATVKDDGWSCDVITLSTLTGTYFETKAHIAAGPTIDRIPLDVFFTEVAIIQLQDKGPGEKITTEEVAERGAHVKRGDAVLFSCGWDRQWGKPGFIVDSPTLSFDAMEWLVSKQPCIIGGDIPCFDDPRGGPGGAVARMFESDIFLLAPVVNLRNVKSHRARLVALPLNVKGVCGFPCRAVIMEEQ